VKVRIPGALRSYSMQASCEALGDTLADVLADLERQFPGIRFRMIDEQDRIRPHIRFFVNGDQVRELTHRLSASSELIIVQALSGG
jgi:molybdopterin synthase sulfur carrier subunit